MAARDVEILVGPAEFVDSLTTMRNNVIRFSESQSETIHASGFVIIGFFLCKFQDVLSHTSCENVCKTCRKLCMQNFSLLSIKSSYVVQVLQRVQ